MVFLAKLQVMLTPKDIKLQGMLDPHSIIALLTTDALLTLVN